MPPKTKASTAKSLIGQPESVIKPEFCLATQDGNLDTDILPFSGPLQLPTSEQVLKLFFFIRDILGQRNSHVSQAAIISKVANQVAKYWDMAGYQTVVKFRLENHVKKELTKYQAINKSKDRTMAGEIKKRDDYLQGLGKLFDVATPNLEDILQKSRILGNDDECTRYSSKDGYTRKTEDISFLIDQRGERKMVMGLRDTSYEERVDKNTQRNINSQGLNPEAGNEYPKVAENEENEAMEGNIQYNDDEEKDANFSVKRRRKKNQTVLVELPADIMNSPEVCAMLDRTGTTSRKAVGVVSSILRTGKVDGKQVDLSQFTLSRPSLERKRVHNRSVLMEQEIEDFKVKMPQYAALHWDGKLIKDVTGSLQEHEAILVSGSPHYLEGKILSVTKLVDKDGKPTGTGEAQANACLDQVMSWGVNENIVALVFDTTSSNSGRVKGATVRLQKALGRPLLFLACRHHVSELIVKACWYSLFEADLSPDCKFFSDIRGEWSSFDTSGEANIITLAEDMHGRQEALLFYQDILNKKNKRNEMAVRDDYRELAECAMVLLGSTPPSGQIVWKKPGACHKARFCAFGIYSLKALAFSVQLNLDDETVELLKKFCSFIATIYIPHFLASSIGSDAVVNDLQLFKKLFEYRSIDPQLADESLVVLRRHLWYLMPEVAVFSLFSKKVSTDDKSRLASKLLTLQGNKPQSYKLEKPKFPVIEEKTRMEDLITPQSFKFFNILGVDCEWLAQSPDKWDQYGSYQVAREFVMTVKVTNDVAERGVKLATDYATILTKDDTIRGMLLQGVERCRRMFPNFLKKTLNIGC